MLDAEFLEDALDVDLRGGPADSEDGADFRMGLSFGDPVCDLGSFWHRVCV